MESLFFRVAQILFRSIHILIITGFFTNVLINIQKRAFESKRVGLVSMLQINEQLVGKTK